MSTINWPDDSAFDPFNIFEERYKIVSGHENKAAVLVPKSLKPSLHPVIVNVHGGFFATAHSLFAPFFAPWALTLALHHGAIIVSADYRLLPTPNGVADRLEDLEDFWRWNAGCDPLRYADTTRLHSLRHRYVTGISTVSRATTTYPGLKKDASYQ